MKKIMAFMLPIFIVLAGCSAPQPKKPDESNRVAVNQDYPVELDEKL